METLLNHYLPDATSLDNLEVVAEGMPEKPQRDDQFPYRLVMESDIRNLVKPRKIFSHKGTYGHALIIAGDTQTMGAALLSAKGCLYAGAGLTTMSIPESGLIALNTALPEVMYTDRKDLIDHTGKYNAIAIGPGLGTSKESLILLKAIFQQKKALILDADALNMMAKHKELLDQMPEGSVLTPHMKEFDRLFGNHKSWFARLHTLRKQAAKYKCVIVLKNQYTFVADEYGTIFINPTGNPGMAQGGMGDVLTGVIAANVAQGHRNIGAAILACYTHGKSGDELAADRFNFTASQVAEYIPKILKELSK